MIIYKEEGAGLWDKLRKQWIKGKIQLEMHIFSPAQQKKPKQTAK